MSNVRPYAPLLVNKADENITRTTAGAIDVGGPCVGTLTLGAGADTTAVTIGSGAAVTAVNVGSGAAVTTVTLGGAASVALNLGGGATALPGPFANDAAAGAGGVPIGGIYYSGADPYVLNINLTVAPP